MLPRMIAPRFFVVRLSLIALALLLAVAGCKPSDPLTAKISADDSTDLFRWQRDITGSLIPELKRQMEGALQEIRLDIQFRGEASGHDPIEAALCKRVNRLTLKDALLLGTQLKWRRLAGEREDLQKVVNTNSRLVTKPGDMAAAADLDLYRGKHIQRLENTIRDLAATEKDYAALGGQVSSLTLGIATTKPVAVTHEEALKQMAEMIEGRRNGAAFNYGQWPVKIDWTGAMLEGEKRAEFEAKKSVNGRGVQVVIPVRIKATWLLFEAPDQAPGLPDDVKAVLSADELVKFKRDWLELEAEIWARQIGKQLPEPPPETPAR